MNKTAYYKLSYGMYVITSIDKNGKKVGCIANCAIQVTSSPSQILVSLNHDNYTNSIIKQSKRLAIMVLGQDTPNDIIATFGFHSSKDIDKFQSIPYKMIDGLPIIDDAIAYFILDVNQEAETSTHTLFIGEVKDCEVLSDNKEMTYDYYHQIKKGSSPKNAPTFQETKKPITEEGKKLHHFRCLVCGYIQETEAEELPDDYTCPLCGASKDMFEKID
ncbi:MAG: flavin reductase [Bacilli bacterium]